MTRDTRDGRVDDLRRQLRSLGYLDAGVDRFVLGSARGARGPSTIAALASVRVGLVAAALLGPAAAVGIASRLPGLVTGPRDAVVVALYLGLIFGLAATAFTFVVSTLAARLADRGVRRTRWISRGAGTLVTAGCLTYLTLWWRSANAGLAWSAPVWTLFAIGVAVAISLLLGHAVSITAFAVMTARARSSGGPDAEGMTPTDATSRSTWRLVLLAGVLAFAGAAALLVITAPASGVPGDRPPLAVVSPGLRVKVIAIDGFDPDVFESLRATGVVPALSRLLSSGLARFSPDETRDPARAWSTIATGQSPDVHGVRGLETRRVAGLQGALMPGSSGGLARALNGTTDLLRLTRPSTASGAELRTKPFWEVASDAGMRAAVVNWWATWPATGTAASGPLVISDRATLRLERGGALDAEIAPKELYDRLRVDWPVLTQEAAQAASTPLFQGADPEASAVLRRSAELDALQIALSKRLPEKPDLIAVYLPGLDVVQHTLLGAGGSAASTISARLDNIRSYYRYLDLLLADFTRSSPDEIVIVVTQPGRLASAARGAFAVTGVVAAPAVNVQARAVDVAPTILHVLGLPVSRELSGNAIAGVFLPSFMARFPVREVPTYGARAAGLSTGRGEALDAEALERLRSLGYVR